MGKKDNKILPRAKNIKKIICYFVDFKTILKENSTCHNNPEIIKHKKLISLTIEEFEPWKNIKVCYICEEKLNVKDKRLRKGKNHHRFTGKYRGKAHCICNLIYVVPKEQ